MAKQTVNRPVHASNITQILVVVKKLKKKTGLKMSILKNSIIKNLENYVK